MDYSKTTKDEIFAKLNDVQAQLDFKDKELEKIKSKLEKISEKCETAEKEIESMIKSKDQAIKNEHDVRRELQQEKDKTVALIQENEQLKQTLNQLANIFDEGFQEFQDQTSMLGVVLRTSNIVLGTLKAKVDAFNNPQLKGEDKK